MMQLPLNAVCGQWYSGLCSYDKSTFVRPYLKVLDPVMDGSVLVSHRVLGHSVWAGGRGTHTIRICHLLVH